jgi:hypothetical protein
VNARPLYKLLLRPEPGVDPERALRHALKVLLRRFGLRAISAEEIADHPPKLPPRGPDPPKRSRPAVNGATTIDKVRCLGSPTLSVLPPRLQARPPALLFTRMPVVAARRCDAIAAGDRDWPPERDITIISIPVRAA